MTEQFRSQPENPKQNRPEAGAGPLGVSPPDPEQQPLPRVWDVMEREVRLESPEFQMTREEYYRENLELRRLADELEEKGTPRDQLIIDLYRATTKDPTVPLLSPSHYRDISLEEFQQFRSRIEPMHDEEIREELRKVEEEFERKYQ